MTEDSLPDGGRQDGLPRGESNSTVASLGTIHGSRSNEPLVNGWTKAKPLNGVSTQPAEVHNDVQLSGAGPPISDDEDQGGPCGWFGFYPNFLQRFRSPRWVLFFLCWAGALQGLIVNGFVNVVITTIERRYHLNSKESGLIAGGYDIASFLCLIPVSYFGASRRKPFLIGQGVLILALGSFVFSIPHFASSRYSFSIQSVNTCDMKDDVTCSTMSQQSGSKLTNFKFVFLLGQLLHGTGAAPFYTLGCTYLDENVSTKMSSVYIGIYYTMAIIGPAAGYILGGQFLKIYVDPDADPKLLGIDQNSTVWVGAWWLGFVLAAAIGLVVAIPLSAFPKTLPGSKKVRALKVPEMHQKLQDSAAAENNFGTTLRDLPKSLKYLICNPTFLFLSLAGASEGMLVSGLATFLPKIIESQFSIPASTAALYVGLVTVPGAGGGTFLGGYLVKKLKLRCSGIIRMCIIFSSICLCFGLVFLLSCPAPSFSGVNHSMTNETITEDKELIRFDRDCNQGCGCSRFRYDPVCSYDNVIYYSPCYAGCKKEHIVEGRREYENCSCVSHTGENRSLSESSSVMIQTVREKCKNHCTHLPVFLLLIFMCMTFTFLVSMPSLSATLRCVADTQKSFALGIQWMTVRLLGTIPAPILFGVLIDSSCSLWDKKCNESGSCLFYNNKLMNQNTLILACILKSLSTIYFFFAWFLYRPPKDGEESESEERTDKVPVENGSYQMNPALKAVET